ncbi:hypothetical protein QBC39DRAFT_406991 [Podospora conica]|nr:hypothetical protein QBC39DRAFT_406991 [Schizothecium conicum]
MDHQPPNAAAYNNTQGTTASGYANTHTDHAHHSANTHGTLNHNAHTDHTHNNHANALPGGAHNTPTYGDSPTTGPAAHTAGHHKHDLLNKLDPSVDSSRDKVALPPPGGAGATNGPHHSRLANKLDMTVDTEAYERANLGTSAASATYQNAGVPDPTHNAGARQRGVAGLMSGGSAGAPEGTYGPHGSRVANAADPRVDSDRDGSHGHGQHQGVGAGYDQRGVSTLQSGLGQQHQQGHHLGGSTLPGPAPNTAGPHKSDVMNKLDPKVDSTGGLVNEIGQRRAL